ncbi:MAG: membrane protein insertase YidC [Candidatus Kapaibacterium sp.]
MDKRSLLGLVLITIIVIVWLVFQSAHERPVPENLRQERPDTTAVEQPPHAEDTVSVAKALNDSLIAVDKYGRYFADFASGSERVITIENDLVKAKISNRGGSLIQWELKNYKKWDGVPTRLIWKTEGELFVTFLTMESKQIDSRELYFQLDADKDYYKISGNDSYTLTARIPIDDQRALVKRLTFYGDKYHLDAEIVLENMQSVIPSRGYNFGWDKGLRYQESNSVDESAEALAMVSLNGEMEQLDADENEPVETSVTGLVDFAAVKIKYFEAAIIPQPYQSFDGTVDLYGTRHYVKDEGIVEQYAMSLRVPYDGGVQTDKYRVFIGPMDYDLLSSYGLESTINFGFEWIVAPIGEYFMLPIFHFIHKFVPNYGISIIIFAIIIKFLLYPLSIQQMRSAQKMKLLGPEMQKIREKYKDDNTKQQKELMGLYSQYGINPASGCLPLLLQMPILYSMWTVLRTAIDLRQADFVLWINDLSQPDVILELPFKIPLFGMDKFSGLALLMGVTMFIQQKMTITDPRQKGMIYIMPVMFTLIFSSFPSGLNLYYFVFNLLGIGQQVYIEKFSRKKITLEDLKKAPKKEGWFQKKMREAQEVAESQGRSVPGQRGGSTKTKYQRKKKK